MTGRHKTGDQMKAACILRDAGYSLSTIAERTGISTATLARHFKKLGASKRGLTSDAVNDARQQLLNDGAFITDLKCHIAAAVLDDLSQISALR